MLDRQPWQLVEQQLALAGSDPAETLPRIRRYAEMLLEWNRGFSNLISASDETRLVERHIVESLSPAKWIKEAGPKSFMDFGSGGGFPAIPLALAGVGERWVLVESRRNKTLFLRKVSEELGLKVIEVELARLEMLLDDAGRIGRFDAFTSRATLRLGPTLSLAANWVAAGGHAGPAGLLGDGDSRPGAVGAGTGAGTCGAVAGALPPISSSRAGSTA